jgi:two-component system nitrogen regulation response regulator GlnG
VLSDGQFYRVGGHQPIKANVRVIAATHQNLEERVRQGLFREDLYHRLNVIRLRLPSLRERREDIPLLAKHFLAKSARELGVEPKKLSEEAIQYISHMPFPGNVRQLENLCHWLTVLAPAQVVKVEDLPLEARQGNWLTAGEPANGGASPAVAAGIAVQPAGPVMAGTADWLAPLTAEVERRLQAGVPDVMDALTRDFEAAVIRAALKHTHGRRIDAATRLGVGRNTITRKIQDLGLED